MRSLCLFLVLLSPLTLFAQPAWTEISIPMSDGASLFADLYLPAETGEHPVILIQTPYNKALFQAGLPLGIGDTQTEQPYAFVIMDWRGSFANAGAANPDVSRGEDGYSAVEWIAEQDWCDGNVGTWGPSALGQVQWETAREQPPHLVCMVPQVSSPHTLYEQYYPGGILRTEYVNTLGLLFGANPIVVVNDTYNLVWQIAENSSLYFDEIEVPTLITAGWYDHNIEDCLFEFDQLKAVSSAADEAHILIGPWVHGGNGPAFVGSEVQGELSYPDAAAYNTFRELQFFDHHLRGLDNGWDDQAPVEHYRLGEAGWNNAEVWPPQDLYIHALYLSGQPGDLYLDASPPDVLAEPTYTYDPEDPSPTIGGMTLAPGLNQGPYDQVPEVESRDDNLIFTSFDWAHPIEGRVVAHLEFASDQVDTDVVLRLTEVYPDGRSMLLTEGALRLRYRNGFTADEVAFLTPGVPVEVEVPFKPLSHQIAPGNHLRLVVTSSNSTRLNRNMNNGEALYPDLQTDAVFNPIVAENTVFTGLSRLEIPSTSLPDHVAEMEQDWKVWVWGEELILERPTAQPEAYTIYSLQGRTVAQGLLEGPRTTVALTGLTTGMYLISGADGQARKFQVLR